MKQLERGISERQAIDNLMQKWLTFGLGGVGGGIAAGRKMECIYYNR